jgi:hypothetical protein
MDQTDAFFTHTIVGAPLTVLLGRRQTASASAQEGLMVDLHQGQERLSALWRDWVVLHHACDPVGTPRRRPRPLRLWLERHALWIAVCGLLTLLIGAVLCGVQAWS